VKHTLGLALAGTLGWALALWAFGALWFDAAPAAAWGFVAALFAARFVLRRTGRSWFVPFAGFAAVLFWWLTLAPSHERHWSTEYSRLPYASIEGDSVILHNVRNFDYPSGGAPVPRWETRTFKLSDVEAVDLAVNYWGSPWIAHPIVSFRFKNAPPLAFSIETRREDGEAYSALAGFYRQYELIVLAGDERDLLGVRTVYGQGEDVYLYATITAPGHARARLLEYLATLNGIHTQPRWYNAVTSNCTTAIRGMSQSRRMPLDWRLLINGKGDEMLYEHGLLRTNGLSFAELKRKAWTNPAAVAAFTSGDFSRQIRQGRPEFLHSP
jgi:hypothetical protein